MLLDTDTLTAEDYEAARQAIEDVLVEWRDSRLSLVGRNNGLVIREFNGHESSVIRMGPEDAIRIGIEAIVRRRHHREGER